VAGLALLERIERDGVLSLSDLLTQPKINGVAQWFYDEIRSGDELPGC
jgi:hypothetical protein